MNRLERAAVIDRFCRNAGTILIATDAAGQGLNLHQSCRLVVNVELPWNPMRLEQRIGRVDRIGQVQIVHAIHLVAADTFEVEVLARLKMRVNRARAAIDAADPIGTAAEFDAVSHPALDFVEQRKAAGGESERISTLRALRLTREAATLTDPKNGGRPLRIFASKLRRFRTLLRGRTLLLYRVDVEDRDGRIVESCLVPLAVGPSVCDRASVVPPASTIEAWQRRIADTVVPFHVMRLARANAIALDIAASPMPLFQPALFDRRAERAHRGALDRRTEDLHEIERVTAAIERQAIGGDPIARVQLIAQP